MNFNGRNESYTCRTRLDWKPPGVNKPYQKGDTLTRTLNNLDMFLQGNEQFNNTSNEIKDSNAPGENIYKTDNFVSYNYYTVHQPRPNRLQSALLNQHYSVFSNPYTSQMNSPIWLPTNSPLSSFQTPPDKINTSNMEADCSNTNLQNANQKDVDKYIVPKAKLTMPFFTQSKTKFFIIKSITYENVVLSQSNNIWASTKLGNQRLSKAYSEGENDVYLIFSVNASGHFCGICKMESGLRDPADSKDLWVYKDKWTRDFDVKWLINSEIPNRLFNHLVVPQNENRPVTHSRDTQEIPFSVGMEIFATFCNYRTVG